MFFSRNTVARPVGPSSQGANIFFTKYGVLSSVSLLSVGGIIIFRVIRRHFLACEDIASGSDLSAMVTFFLRNTEALSVGPRCQVEESLFSM